MDVRYVFTHTDGKIYIRRKILIVKSLLFFLVVFFGPMPQLLNSYKEHELIVAIVIVVIFVVDFGIYLLVEMLIKTNRKRSVVLEKTQVTRPPLFTIHDVTTLSDNPDPYIGMAQKSNFFGKFTLSIDDVDVDFSGLSTDVYLIAYLFYNNELKVNGRFLADYSKVFGNTALLLRDYLMLIAFIAMSTNWFFRQSSLGYYIGIVFFLVSLLAGQFIGKKTGICIHQNKIALTNKEMGGGILDVDGISRIENDIIYDVNGKPMTFEGVEGWRYKRLARILSRYIEKKEGKKKMH